MLTLPEIAAATPSRLERGGEANIYAS